MGVLASLFAGTPNPSSDFWYNPVGTLTDAGVRVDQASAQKVSAWYRGRDILATVLAMLPLHLMERLPDEGGSEIARGHPLYDVLHDKPNAWQDSFQWRRQQMYHLIDHGNSYSRIVSGGRGVVDQLQPIHPSLVTPVQVSSGRIVYNVRDPRTNIVQQMTQEGIFHLRGASDDGIVGKGILEVARTSLGTALATESYASLVFGKGTLNSGVIENPGVLDDEAMQRMAASFVTAAGNWHLPKVLEQGSKWVESKMSPEDAQMLLSRKFSVDDMARWLGVPRQMLENSDPSFGNAEQFDQNFITYTMGPWLSLFEFSITDQLILNPRRFFAQFTRQAFVRGKFSERTTGLVALVNAGIYSVDEARAVEDMNKRGGKADELREPQNITGKPTVPEEPPSEPTPKKMPEESAAVEPTDQLQAIVIASAGRLLRKEVKAVQRFAVQHADDQDAFASAVSGFYGKHAALVAETLQMSEADAAEYCSAQARLILASESGPRLEATLQEWETTAYAEGLASWVLDIPAPPKPDPMLAALLARLEQPIHISSPVTIARDAIRVTVAPPKVSVDAPVTIAEGAMQVTAPLTLFAEPRKVKRVVERDPATGDITGSVETAYLDDGRTRKVKRVIERDPETGDVTGSVETTAD